MKLLAILFLSAVAVVACATQATAQKPDRSLYVSTDTSTNADTVIIPFANIGSRVKAFQTTVTKLGGTVGGKVYLEGNIDGLTWVRLDSLSNANAASNSKVFPITVTTYNSYRFYYISSGTQSSTIRAAYMRRPDE